MGIIRKSSRKACERAVALVIERHAEGWAVSSQHHDRRGKIRRVPLEIFALEADAERYLRNNQPAEAERGTD